MNRLWIALLACGFFSVVAMAAVQAPPEGKRTRVGVYDSRAIAIAYAPSRFNPVREKTKELEQAKAAGDSRKVKELEAWGEKHQRALHRQGFGRVPVGDLLDPVRDRLPGVAREARVDVICAECDFSAADVELVDVTRALALLYEPSEKTLGYIDEIKQHAPVDLDEIDRGHDH
ncbi:MAG: hypothetical protein AB7O52_04370 [Planctomycetota bacterium]